MQNYIYKPVRFYITVFIATWAFWVTAIVTQGSPFMNVFMFFGLISPAVIAVISSFICLLIPCRKK